VALESGQVGDGFADGDDLACVPDDLVQMRSHG
jgi:hypothetical protein